MADAVTTHEGHLTTTRESAFEIGSLTEASGGAAAIILAVIGLLHIAPAAVASIATIVVGASFVLLGGVLARRWSHMLAETEWPAGTQMIGEGVVMEAVCGAAGIVLGILSLATLTSVTLVAVAALVFGGGLLCAGATTAQLNAMATATRRTYPDQPERGSYYQESYLSPSPSLLLAMTGIVLGILALAGFNPVTLSLVAMLTFGVAVLFSGTSFMRMVVTAFAK